MSHNAKAKKKVLIVYPFYMHYRKPVIDELIQNGRHDYFFAGDTQDQKTGIETCKVEPPERFLKIKNFYLGNVLLQFGVLRLLFRHRFDCVILLGNAAWPTIWSTAVVARLVGKRVLFWTHGWISRERGIRGLLRNTLYRLGHGMLLYGHTAKRIGIDNGFSEDRLYVAYNALDYANQSKIRDAVSDDEKQSVRYLFQNSELPIVICSSRLTPQRRLGLLFDAAVKLRQTGQEINILLVGSGPERENLESHAKDSGLNVHFYGACYDEQKLAAMTMASTATVAPGKIGLTAIQSLTYGTPVITHGNSDNQMPEFEAVVPGDNGDLFVDGDIDSLATVIAKWIGMSEEVTKHYRVVAERYNPTLQRQVFDAAVDGSDISQVPYQDEPCWVS